MHIEIEQGGKTRRIAIYIPQDPKYEHPARPDGSVCWDDGTLNPHCPSCGGSEVWRESVDVGVGVIYGPYGCFECGWSESHYYDQRATSGSPANQEGEFYQDSRGMLYPTIKNKGSTNVQLDQEDSGPHDLDF